MMSRVSLVPAVLGTILMCPAAAPAASPGEEAALANNAALTYWRAFALMPKLDDDQQAAIRKSLDNLGPVDKTLIPVIESSEPALKELHRGAKLPACVWGTAFDEGPNAMMPHLSKARELARLACLRAHLRFERGQPAGAIDDVTAVMALGRHVGSEGLLMSLLVDYVVEYQAIWLAAAYLSALQPNALNTLSRNLDDLPALKTIHQAIVTEKEVFLEWAIRELAEEGGKERYLRLFGNSDDPTVTAIKGLSRTQLRKSLIDLRAFYDKLADIVLLPPEKTKPAEAALIADPGLKGPVADLARMLAPGASATRYAEAKYQARLAMLKAAIAVVEHGQQALSQEGHRDPFGDGPFKYSAFEGGFELSSKLTDRQGKPVSLTVGRRAAE
jgi:hypothetical protein